MVIVLQVEVTADIQKKMTGSFVHPINGSLVLGCGQMDEAMTLFRQMFMHLLARIFGFDVNRDVKIKCFIFFVVSTACLCYIQSRCFFDCNSQETFNETDMFVASFCVIPIQLCHNGIGS